MKIKRTILIRFEADVNAVCKDNRDTERRLLEEQLFDPVKTSMQVFHQTPLRAVAFRVDIFEGVDSATISASPNTGGVRQPQPQPKEKTP